MHTFSNSETPTVYEIVSLPKHKNVRLLEDNHELAARFAALGCSPKEFFRVDIGDIELDGWMIKPAGFDPTQKYPVIFFVYGEPWQSTVQNSWSGGDLWSRFLAQQGYVVMSVDPRGTATPRGHEWRKCVYGKIGILKTMLQPSPDSCRPTASWTLTASASGDGAAAARPLHT